MLALAVTVVVLLGQRDDLTAFERKRDAAYVPVFKLAKTKGCTEVSECRVLAAGQMAMGGPSEQIVYCSKTTDLKALEAAAKKAKRTETQLLSRYRIMSAEGPPPPRLELKDGECVGIRPEIRILNSDGGR